MTLKQIVLAQSLFQFQQGSLNSARVSLSVMVIHEDQGDVYFSEVTDVSLGGSADYVDRKYTVSVSPILKDPETGELRAAGNILVENTDDADKALDIYKKIKDSFGQF